MTGSSQMQNRNSGLIEKINLIHKSEFGEKKQWANKFSGKLIYERTLDIVTEHEHDYWFYVPEAGVVSGRTIPFHDDDLLQSYSPAGNTVIKAGFSFRDDKRKMIARSRLFVISGYYDEQGEYISRPECVTKIYNKLVRIVKKVAPLTELTDKYISTKDDAYLQES